MEQKQVYGRIWREDKESGPPERSQKIGFLSHTDPDPMKNRKDTKPEFNVRHHRDASKTPFKWRFTGGPMMSAFSGVWILSLLINKKASSSICIISPLINEKINNTKKNVIKLTKVFWIRA